MELGLSTFLFEDYKLLSILPLYQEAGIKYLEIKPQKGHFDYQDPEYLHRVARELKKHNLKVQSMHMPVSATGVDISLIEEYDRVWSVREVEKTVLALLRLNGEIIVVHPGSTLSGEKERRIRQEKSEKSLEEILKFCEHWGIKIALENTLPGKTGDNIIDVLSMVKKFSSPNLGICLDSGHYHITTSTKENSEVIDCFSKLKDYLLHVHLHDNQGKEDEHNLPGEGNIDWSSLMKGLREINYQGIMMFEIRKKNNTPGKEILEKLKNIYLQLLRDN
ncbi:MAG: sugar phosphate isomerase/epimerase [Candidatus Caldatribacteriota bacterium]